MLDYYLDGSSDGRFIYLFDWFFIMAPTSMVGENRRRPATLRRLLVPLLGEEANRSCAVSLDTQFLNDKIFTSRIKHWLDKLQRLDMA